MVQNTPSPPRSRGRPRGYDPQAAIAKALDTFWTAGYEATSLDDLVAATGMNRPSLYGAFGDKHALFLKALQAYRDRSGGVMSAVAAEGGPLRTRLGNAYRAALDIYYEGGTPRGCFLTGAATVGAVEDQAVAQAIREALAEIDAGFVGLFVRARRKGEIPPSADPEALGRIASSLIHSLSLRARTGTPRAELDRLAEDTVTLLAGSPAGVADATSPVRSPSRSPASSR